MYCDLDRFRASDNPPATVPINLVSTSARPDVVVQEGSRITLLELTVPHNSAESLRAAHRLKQSKANYCCLLGDLERAGFESELVTLEIGSLGHWRANLATSLARHLLDQYWTTLLRMLLLVLIRYSLRDMKNTGLNHPHYDIYNINFIFPLSCPVYSLIYFFPHLTLARTVLFTHSLCTIYGKPVS